MAAPCLQPSAPFALTPCHCPLSSWPLSCHPVCITHHELQNHTSCRGCGEFLLPVTMLCTCKAKHSALLMRTTQQRSKPISSHSSNLQALCTCHTLHVSLVVSKQCRWRPYVDPILQGICLLLQMLLSQHSTKGFMQYQQRFTGCCPPACGAQQCPLRSAPLSRTQHHACC